MHTKQVLDEVLIHVVFTAVIVTLLKCSIVESFFVWSRPSLPCFRGCGSPALFVYMIPVQYVITVTAEAHYYRDSSLENLWR